MKILLLTLCIVLLAVANVRADCCSGGCDSLPGLTQYESDNVYRGDQSNGCPCSCRMRAYDMGVYNTECRTGGSIDVPG